MPHAISSKKPEYLSSRGSCRRSAGCCGGAGNKIWAGGGESARLRQNAGRFPGGFRHYADKRALLTAFAAKALGQMAEAMQARGYDPVKDDDPFMAVGLAYIDFALEKPAMFQLMWRRDLINETDEAFRAAREAMSALLATGFAETIKDEDPTEISAGGATGLVLGSRPGKFNGRGPVGRSLTFEGKQALAREMLEALMPAFRADKERLCKRCFALSPYNKARYRASWLKFYLSMMILLSVDVVRFALDKDGYSVFRGCQWNGGAGGFAAHRPDLIILDIMMPEMDGTGYAAASARKARCPSFS